MTPENEDQICVDQLQKQLARMESEVSVIHSLSGEINTTLDPDRIFQVSMESLDKAFEFRHSLILLADAKGQNLEVVASHGYPESGIGAQIPVGLGVI
ncbi:MAG TPA: adenylate cyclase, partial [Leptospiraceae bacterium]|nr:adenylate cyclase [Leptospiraceae bacterium]